MGALLDSKEASKKISSKASFLTELRPLEVLHISEFSNTKLAIFSWCLRHSNGPSYINMAFPNPQNHFFMLSRIFFHITFPLSEPWVVPYKDVVYSKEPICIVFLAGLFGMKLLS